MLHGKKKKKKYVCTGKAVETHRISKEETTVKPAPTFKLGCDSGKERKYSLHSNPRRKHALNFSLFLFTIVCLPPKRMCSGLQ